MTNADGTCRETTFADDLANAVGFVVGKVGSDVPESKVRAAVELAMASAVVFTLQDVSCAVHARACVCLRACGCVFVCVCVCARARVSLCVCARASLRLCVSLRMLPASVFIAAFSPSVCSRLR
eukprot:4939717-Alexandrium_andersonii.AAC.1